MSNKYPCVYYDNGKCQKFSDDFYNDWCDCELCCDRVPPQKVGKVDAAKHMQAARLSRGMNRAQLSRASGVAKVMIEKYELKGTYPGLRHLWSLADALDITIDEYVGRTKKVVK